MALSISALKGVDNVLRKFYRAVFPGHVPLKLTIKKHLRQFSGIQEGDRDLVQSRLANLELSAELKPICQLLDISSSGTREAVVDRVVAFLLKPEASGNAYAGKPATTAVKRKRASGGKKGDKKDGPSRPMSGYMLFATEQRSTIAAKHPGASVRLLSCRTCSGDSPPGPEPSPDVQPLPRSSLSHLSLFLSPLHSTSVRGHRAQGGRGLEGAQRCAQAGLPRPGGGSEWGGCRGERGER